MLAAPAGRDVRILLALVLLAPLALAQAPIPLVELSIDPFADLAKPLQAPVSTAIHARVSCALVRGPNGIPISYSVVSAPAWATVTIDPPTDVIEPLVSCDTTSGGWVTREAVLSLQANDRAPAEAPAPIEVEVRADGTEEAALASVDVAASFFSILDVELIEAIHTMSPGATKEIVITVTNHGNGATRVTFETAEIGEGLTVALPDPFVLESAQSGGTRLSEDAIVRVTTADRSGFVNEVGIINLRILSAFEGDPSQEGDESQASLLVTTRTGIPASRDVPGPEIAAIGAALLAGAAMRGRSGRTRP